MRFASTCRRRWPVAGVVVLGALVSTVAAPGAQAPATFRSGTELVVLQVSVVGPERQPVAGLQQADFSVFEEGRSQAISLFASTNAPLDMMLLLDTSVSMNQRMAATQAAAINFVRTLRTEDRGAVVLFSDTVRIAQPLTGDHGALEQAIRDASTGGGTALYEALYVAMRELARVHRRTDPMRRQALVVLSDGEDTGSRLVFDDVLEEARRNAVTMFTITPSAPAADAFGVPLYRRPGAAYEMGRLAKETGGRTFAPERIDELAGVYGEITDELSRQYWLAFVPAPSSGGFRRLSVRIVGDPNLRARTRTGYYAQRSLR